MALPVPTTLSPSKVSAFTDCALAFRFSAIDRLPEPPSPWATRGTLVHAALERLFCLAPPERTPAAGLRCLHEAYAAMAEDPELTGLALDGEAETAFLAEAATLVERYFALEDPAALEPVGLELRLEAQVGGVRLRGVIDRLELDADGELIVTDYKTGAVPDQRHEQARLGGVHFYALLCEQFFGKRPAKVQLLYLREPVAIIATPSAQSSRGLQRKVAAIWEAVERACAKEDFRPRPSRLCDWCSYRAWCPAWGGDPSAAAAGTAAPMPAVAAAPMAAVAAAAVAPVVAAEVAQPQFAGT